MTILNKELLTAEDVRSKESDGTRSSLRPARDSVSVCIPTFNGAKWILPSINSVLSQSCLPFEILVIDDASTDDTVELVRSLENERIRLIVNDRNLGIPVNWNRCVDLSRGEFVKFLFQDDLLYPECIEKMVRLLLANPSLGLVFCRVT